MNSQTTLCYVNDWLIDMASGSLIHRKTGEQKRLGEYQLKLLESLITHAGRVLTREELTEQVWQQRVVGNNSLPNAIHALRLALEDNGKHQRIIKTIPKRGYLLEKAYCSFEDRHASSDMPSSYEAHIPDVSQSGSLSASTSQAKKAIRKWSVYLLVLFCVISLGVSASLYFRSTQNVAKNGIHVQQLEATPYKRIQLFQVTKGANDSVTSDDPDKLDQRLQPTLQKLDNRLNQTHSNLSIYYQTSDAILNYVFVIESPCQRKELSMNIYHWRTNTERLNDLILRETERTLNEAVICID